MTDKSEIDRWESDGGFPTPAEVEAIKEADAALAAGETKSADEVFTELSAMQTLIAAGPEGANGGMVLEGVKELISEASQSLFLAYQLLEGLDAGDA